MVIPFQHLSSDAELAITFLLHRLLGRVIQYVLRAVRFPLASKTCKQRRCSGPKELWGAPGWRKAQGFCLFFVLPSQNLFLCKQGCIINLPLKTNHQPKCPRLKVTCQGLFQYHKTNQEKTGDIRLGASSAKSGTKSLGNWLSAKQTQPCAEERRPGLLWFHQHLMI